MDRVVVGGAPRACPKRWLRRVASKRRARRLSPSPSERAGISGDEANKQWHIACSLQGPQGSVEDSAQDLGVGGNQALDEGSAGGTPSAGNGDDQRHARFKGGDARSQGERTARSEREGGGARQERHDRVAHQEP